jgi:chromosomal replication initiator protein
MFYCLTYQCDLPSRDLLCISKKPEKKNINVLDIIYVASLYFKIPVIKIIGPKRNRDIIDARHMIMYFIKNYSNLSLSEIGKHFGNRDHTTVIYAVKTVGIMRSVDERYNNEYILFESYINNYSIHNNTI